MEAATTSRSNSAEQDHRGAVKNGEVTRRVTWLECDGMPVVPFPHNPIYTGRLDRMRRRWGGYRHDLIDTPVLYDNSADAFPEFPAETHFVGDGNHRRALAEADGMLEEEFIAKIHRGLSNSAMHERRQGYNDRRTVKPAEDFLHEVAKNSQGLEARLKRDVESLGWHISYDREAWGLPCTNELTWIYRKDPGAMARTIQTYEAAFGTKPEKSQSRVIKGLGAFWLKYPDADNDRLLKSLTGVTVSDLYKSGRNQNDEVIFIKSVFDGIRYSLAMGYNRRARGGRLEV